MEKAISFCFQKENKTFYYNERNKPMLNLWSSFMLHILMFFFKKKFLILFKSFGMYIFVQTKIKYVNDFFF